MSNMFTEAMHTRASMGQWLRIQLIASRIAELLQGVSTQERLAILAEVDVLLAHKSTEEVEHERS